MKGLKVLLEFCVPAVMCPLETFLQLHLFDIVALVFVLLPLKNAYGRGLVQTNGYN